MTLRFEDLVLDYDRSVKKIEEFVGLSPERHDRPRSAFDPARSKANIGLWKKWPDRRAMVLSAANLRDTAMTDRKDHCDKDMPR